MSDIIEYKLSEEDLKAVEAAHREKADINPVWQVIADKMGFQHDTMQPVQGRPGSFTALPIEEGK